MAAITMNPNTMEQQTLYPNLIIDALKTVRYPGNGKNIVELGMVVLSLIHI